jgi:hypothetical protein
MNYRLRLGEEIRNDSEIKGKIKGKSLFVLSSGYVESGITPS